MSRNHHTRTPESSITESRFCSSCFVNVLFIPALKDKQSPQGLAVVVGFGELFVKQQFYVGIMKNALAPNPFPSLRVSSMNSLRSVPSHLARGMPKPFFCR